MESKPDVREILCLQESVGEGCKSHPFPVAFSSFLPGRLISDIKTGLVNIL